MPTIQQQLQALEQEKKRLLQQQARVRANRSFVCLCGARHKFKDCDGIRFWQPSYNSYEDGSWGELHIVCPRAGVINRIWFDIDRDIPYEQQHEFDNNLQKQFEHMYEHLLRGVVNHPGNSGVGEFEFEWANNSHIGHNYKRYELHVKYFEDMKRKMKGK